MKCPHCQKEFNAGKVMGSAKSPAKKAAAKKRGEVMRRAFANDKKLMGAAPPATVEDPVEFVNKLIPLSVDTRVMPKGSLSREDLKKLLSGGRMPPPIDTSGISLKGDTPMHEIPCAPFEFKDDEGNLHRVKAYGKTLKVCFMRDGVEEPMRNLAAGELESLWLKRIIK